MPLSPADAALGITVAGGVARLTVGPRHHNPNGVVHGGVLSTLADTAMADAVIAAGAHEVTNVDLHLRFLRPTTAGEIVATARILKQGRRAIFTACTITQGDRVVAEASSTFLVLHLQEA